jgi:hypothetical protein
VIYLDSSVVLAELFGEDVHPPDNFWRRGGFIASRLIEYEVWNRVHARGAGTSHGDDAKTLMSGVALVEMSAAVLARATRPFPVAIRTLDALHLATIEFLRSNGQSLELATYDGRLSRAAASIGVPLAELNSA